MFAVGGISQTSDFQLPILSLVSSYRGLPLLRSPRRGAVLPFFHPPDEDRRDPRPRAGRVEWNGVRASAMGSPAAKGRAVHFRAVMANKLEVWSCGALEWPIQGGTAHKALLALGGLINPINSKTMLTSPKENR